MTSRTRRRKISAKRVAQFQTQVMTYYREHGRHSLPWRMKYDPYHVLVSEIMLQQTQVDRVIPKYTAFLKSFPTVEKLAQAKLSAVLELWSGLGYNRRARMLHEAAKYVVKECDGTFPKEIQQLEKLPGVGPYTARAVTAFAYNKPVVMIETNIRAVFLHEFFRKKSDIHDSDIMPLIEQTAEGVEPREWYAALMDYGTYLKKLHPNPSRKSTHHTKQSKFEGSLRQIRGSLLPLLFRGSLTLTELVAKSGFEKTRVEDALVGLAKDGMVRKKAAKWEIAT